MDTKPILVSTPRGDKSQFDDFWEIKRSELEALKKKPIKIDLSDVCSSVDDILMPVIKPMSEREFESLPHTENYEIAKMYREAMRSTPSVEKLLRQRR